MRNWSDITNHGDVQTDRLNRANRRFTTSARAFNQDFYFFQAVPHRLPTGILSDKLRGVRCALA
jgi:hypothetical protein